LSVAARISASSPAPVTPQWYLIVAKMSMERNPPRLLTARLPAACTSWPNIHGTGNAADDNSNSVGAVTGPTRSEAVALTIIEPTRLTG
jgi:hypothetical protein